MSTPPPINYPSPQPMTPEDQRLWSTLAHVGGIFFGFWAPLIGYLVFKDRGGFVREHTATALNFQLTMLIASIIGAVLCLVIIGFFILIGIAVVIVVFSVIAAMAANNGQPYRYPLAIEFVR